MPDLPVSERLLHTEDAALWWALSISAIKTAQALERGDEDAARGAIRVAQSVLACIERAAALPV